MKQADDRSRRCFLKASSMLGVAVAFSPTSDRRGICGFETQNYSTGERCDTNKCQRTRRWASS